MLTCRATLEHINKSLGTQVTQHSSLGTQVTQHAKLGTQSGSNVACHIGIQFVNPTLNGFAWVDKV
jgi:hypothetical protein